MGGVAAHRHARRPYGVIARARRDAPPARGPPHRRALRSPALCQHQPSLSQTILVMQCKELLVHGAAPAAWLILEQH